MKRLLPRLPTTVPTGTLSVLASLILAALFFGIAPSQLYQSSNFRHPPGEASADASTPDSIPDLELFPARQRKEHLAQLGVDSWHAAGHRGRGVKIAILDSGFRGYQKHLGTALPARVTVRSFRADGNLEGRDSEHGILCGEVIHAIAPEAEILLANWDIDSSEQFLAAARWARRQGAKVISCSLIMPGWSDGEGGGHVNAELARILGPGTESGDLLCFASAGNTAHRHWSGPFKDHGDGLHEWNPGRTRNELSPWGQDRVSVELYAQPGDEYEVDVLDADGTRVGQSRRHAGGDRTSVTVQFLPERNDSYQVQVRLRQGKGGPFHLVALGGGLECVTTNGSVACPADGPAVLAVGAVNVIGLRASYSSCGPNSSRPKPDFVAPVPFASLWRPRPFSGTSAAAPQAASLAALCWSRHADWRAEQVREALLHSAHDLGPAGHDWETGYGMIALPAQP